MSNVTEFKNRTIDAGGFTTSYIDEGDESRPTVVLLHDGAYGTTAGLCWSDVVQSLSTDYRVVAPDLLGWGGSDKVVYLDRSPYSFRIEHVASFCRALDIDSAYFAGTSFGGSLLMQAVAAGSALPIRKAISISGTGGPFRLQSGIEALADYTPSLDAAAKLTALVVRSIVGLEKHIEQRYENSMIPGHWEAMSAPKLRNPASPRSGPRGDDLIRRLNVSSVPTLLVEGSHDELLEPGWSGKLSRGANSIESVVVDAAHSPNIDDPALAVRLITDFLG